MRTNQPNPDSRNDRTDEIQRRGLTAGTADDTVLVNMSDMFTTHSPDAPGDETSGAPTPVIAGDDTEPSRGAPMFLHAIPLLPGETCACGALLDDGRTACRKCAARGRYSRRHGRRAAGRSGLGAPAPLVPARRLPGRCPVNRGDGTRRVPVRDRRRGLLHRRTGVELIGVSLDRPDHYTRMFPAGDTAFAVLMLPVRALALAVLWATSAPWRAALVGACVLALAVLGH